MKKSIFLFFAAILCAMTANAYNQSAKDLYFDNSEAKWNSCYVYIGHGTWTSVYPLSRVSGTQYLWQLPANFNGGSAWNGATGWVVCYEKWWDSKGESIDKFTWHGDNNVTQKSTSAWVDTKIYKTNGTASTKSDNHTINAYKVTSYTKSNYTVTINTVEGGTLTVKDYDNNAVATGASKIHLTVLKFSAAPASGYVLDAVEINDGTNTTTIAAADLATTTHTLTSAVTITPVWRATTSTVTVSATATNGTVTGGGVVEEGTSVTLTATPADGYKFVNWTVGGAEVSTANPYTFTAEEDVTVVANFEELPKTTVYFVNTHRWTNVKAYAYSPANASWPGVDATKEAEKIGDFDVYSYTATEGKYANVIFNGDGGQTADLIWSEGVDKYYIHGYNGNTGWYTEAEAEAILVVPVEYDYVYLINTNDWAKAYIYTWESEVHSWPGAAMTKEATQIAGKDVYSYKVVKGTTFGGLNFNCGGDECKTGNLTWQAGKYYAPSKDTWYADAAAAEAGLAVNTYTVVGSSAPLFGEAWAAGKAENDMTLVEGTKYELVKTDVSLTVGEIQYKVAVNHAWTEAYPGDNAILNIAEAGKYTVTFTFDSNTKAVNATAELTEAAVVLPTVGVKGAWDGWAATTTLTGDNTSASATVNIATAGIYEFGLDVDGNFQASGATIDKANNSTVVTTNAGNMKLTANVLGDYTFTWTYETNTLTVTYPAGEEVDLTPKYYIAGTQNLTGFDWKENGLEIAKDGDVYKHTFSELSAGTYEFKITDGTWEHQWNYNNLGAAYEEVSQGVDGEGNPNGNIKIVTEEAKNITVIFDATAGKITFEGLTPYVAPLTYTVTVPAGTEKCYIAGNMNSWAFQEMEAVTGETNKFTITIVGAKETDEYKYACQADWAYAEVIDGGGNRTNWSELDAVTAWNKPVVYTYYLMGVNGDWTTGIAMEVNTGAENEVMLTCQPVNGEVKIKRLGDDASEYWYGGKSLKEEAGNLGTNTEAATDGDGNIALEEGIYNFYFNTADGKLWIAAATDCGTEPTPDYTRAVTPGNLGTICLPYNVPAGKASGATFYTLAGKDANGRIAFDEVNGELAAGVSYLFQATATEIVCFYGTESVPTPDEDGAMKGTFVNMTLTELTDIYYFAKNALWSCVDLTELIVPANCAYVDMGKVEPITGAAPVGVRRITLGVNGQNTATGMENIDASAQPVKTIINGQLFILRGEKMYDAQGKLVK